MLWALTPSPASRSTQEEMASETGVRTTVPVHLKTLIWPFPRQISKISLQVRVGNRVRIRVRVKVRIKLGVRVRIGVTVRIRVSN